MDTILSVERTFQYDYIYFDLIFLLIWVCVLLWKKEYGALLFALIISPIIYFIDAYVWWTTKVGDLFIREYFIDGVQIINNGFNHSLEKFGIDFMMTISYSLFNFAWVWLMFKYLNDDKARYKIKYTALWLASWVLVPLCSMLFNLNETVVHSIRNMESQYPIWISITVVSYLVLFIFSKFNIRLTIKLFIIGFIAAFIMEFPLYLFDIRQMGLDILLFDSVFMINQSIPLLYGIFLIFYKIRAFRSFSK